MKLTKKFLLSLYRQMLRIRLCEEALVQPIRDKEVCCPCHLYSGEEAVAAGICASLREKDYVFGTHRSHGHYLAKGGGMKEMIAEIFGCQSGCSRGRGGSMHLIDPDCGVLGSAPIVAGTISLAVGSALASRIRKDGRVTACFFGDGATGEGVLFESLNFAAMKRLPIVFVCENNYYSTHLPVSECRVDEPLVEVGRPFGIWSRQVDGNDVLKVFKKGKEAVERCRAGKGPAFLECSTYRLRGHVGPDDNIQDSRTDIRPRSEVAAWRKKDPVLRLERTLRGKKILGRAAAARITAEVEAEVEAALKFARRSPLPRKEALFTHVYQ